MEQASSASAADKRRSVGEQNTAVNTTGVSHAHQEEWQTRLKMSRPQACVNHCFHSTLMQVSATDGSVASV
jgi:hypothetical protein